MAVIDTLVRITAAVVGGNAVNSLANSIKDVSTNGERMRRSLTQGAIALKAFAYSAAVVEITKFIDKGIELGDHLNDLKQKTGVAVEELGKYKIAAENSGISIDTLASAFGKLNKNIVEARDPTTASAQALKVMGISVLDATGKLKNADQITSEIADRFKDFPDGPQKAALAMALFGKSGADLIPMLNMGSEEIKKFGLVIDQDFASAADAFNDKIGVMKAGFANFGISISKIMLPVLSDTVDAFSELFSTGNSGITFAKAISDSMRVVMTAVSAVSAVIKTAAADIKSLGTVSYGLFQAVKGNFSEAKEIIDGAYAERDRSTAEAWNSFANFQNNQKANSYSMGDGGVAAAAREKATKGGSKTSPAILNSMLAFNPVGAGKEASQLEAATKAADAFIRKQKEEVLGLQEEAKYVGMTSVEIEKMKDARKFDIEVAEKSINLTGKAAEAFKKQAAAIKEARQQAIQNAYDQSRTFEAGAANFFAKYTEDANDAAANTQKVFGDAFKGAEDAFIEFTKSGKINFKSLANSVIEDFARMQFKKSVSGLFDSVSSGLSSGLGKVFSSFFAGGGVMTSSGPLPLRKYASGGVANSAQMAIFGEGSRPEAYVPLPDGRTIPVTMKGGSGGGSNVTYNIDARGADVGVVERIQNALKDLNQNLEKRAVNAVQYNMARDPSYGRR